MASSDRRRHEKSRDNRKRTRDMSKYKSVRHDPRNDDRSYYENEIPVRRQIRHNAKNVLNFGGIKIRRVAFDYHFLFVTFLLVLFGLLMLYSASSSRAYASSGDSLHFVKGQLGGIAFGVVAMVACMKIDYHTLVRLSPAAYIVGVVLLVLVLVPGVGTTVNGATRWLFHFQPSELMKFVIILFVGYYLDKNRRYLNKFFRGFCPCLMIVGLVALLLMLEPHFSATILVLFTTLVMMFTAGGRFKHFVVIIVCAVAMCVVLIMMEPYRLQRITSFLNPFADKQGSGWQIVQSLYAIGSGGIFGVGFGKSRQKYMSLPEPHNDFIFSVIAEELGWVGAIIVIVLFAYFVYRGIKIAYKAPDILGRILVVGVVAIIGIQAVINIGVVTATLPVTGMPLPFFSYGGTAMTFTLAEIGLVLNVSKQERVVPAGGAALSEEEAHAKLRG